MSKRHEFPLLFSYTIHGTKVGKGTSHLYLYTENTSIDIREIDKEEAPIAVKWRNKKTFYHHGSPAAYHMGLFDEYSEWSHTRYFEAKHWTPLTQNALTVSSRGDGVPVRFSQMASVLQQGRLNEAFGMSSVDPFKKTEVVAQPAPDDFSRINDNRYAASKRAIDRLELISINGLVYMSCDQPCIAFGSEGYGSSVVMVSFIVPNRSTLIDRPFDRYYETLPLSMNANMSTLSLPNAWERAHLKCEVLMPETVTDGYANEILADFLVSQYLRPLNERKTSRDKVLANYSRFWDVEQKLSFLLQNEDEMRLNAHKRDLNFGMIERAITALDEADVCIPMSNKMPSRSHA
jgi:hypothetical protein